MENYMTMDNMQNISEDVQQNCAFIKNILTSLCEHNTSFLINGHTFTLEYLNRELIIKENTLVIAKIPFEIIYFELKKEHLDVSQYERAIKDFIEQEISDLYSEKYA